MRELRRRRVFGTVALYIVAAWVVIQAASLLFPGLDIPDRAIRYVWIATVLCFPVAILFAWRFQITSEGILKTPPAAAGENAPNISLDRNDYLMLFGLALILLVIFLRAVQDIRRVDEIVGFSASGREILPNSIAVLPLDNLTGDAEQIYLVEGIHEAMTSTLSQISGLRVKSRTSTSKYRDSEKSLPDIATELGVANMIVGSVRRDDDLVRVTVELVDATTDEIEWTSTYAREMRDLLALQSDIAREVVGRVGVELTPDEITRLALTREVNPDVYETYLKGMYFVKQLEPEAIMRGMQYLHDTVAIDPREPLAYAGLALGYNTIGHGVSAHDAFPKAIAAAEKALEIDELSGEAWAALAEAQLYYDWDWQKAEKTFQRAIQLSPSLDHAYAHYAYLLMLLGRNEEAVAMSEKALDLSPVDPLWAGFTAWLYMLEGRWEEAEQVSQECLQIATALDLCQAQSVVDALSVNATPRDQFHIALAYAAMGESDLAVTWLNAAYESRADWLPWVVHPHTYGGAVEPIRDHPTFLAIVDQMSIPAAQPNAR